MPPKDVHFSDIICIFAVPVEVLLVCFPNAKSSDTLYGNLPDGFYLSEYDL